MKILINVSGNIGGGSRQVAISFINECKKFSDYHYVVVMGGAIRGEIKVEEFPSNFEFIDIETPKFYRLHSLLKKIEKRVRPDVVFTVFGPAYWRPKAPHLVGFAVAHHLTPESEFFKTIPFKEWLLWKIKIFLHIKYINWESDAVVCETTDTQDRSARTFKFDKYYFTVSNTCNSYYSEEAGEDRKLLLPPPQEGEFRLLTLSKYYTHKNLEKIPLVVDRLKARGIEHIRFVLTIDQEHYDRIFSDLYKESVWTTGTVPIWDCPELYRECDAMFLPSMLECFSASYPEAMAMKRPILTSHYGFATSVCRDAAVYFDPLNIESIVDAVMEVYQNKELRTRLIERGTEVLGGLPTAQQRAEAYLNILKTIRQ